MHSVEWIEYQSESEVSAQSNTAKIWLKLQIVLLARAYFVKMKQTYLITRFFCCFPRFGG